MYGNGRYNNGWANEPGTALWNKTHDNGTEALRRQMNEDALRQSEMNNRNRQMRGNANSDFLGLVLGTVFIWLPVWAVNQLIRALPWRAQRAVRRGFRVVGITLGVLIGLFVVLGIIGLIIGPHLHH